MSKIDELRERAEGLDPEAEDFEEQLAELEREFTEVQAEQERQAKERRFAQLKNILGTPSEGPQGSDALYEAVQEQFQSRAPINVAVRTKIQAEKALLSGVAPLTQQLPEVVAPKPAIMRIRDVIGVVSITERAVNFVRETGYTISANVTAEGATKPESAITLEAVTETAKTIAHHIPVTRQALGSRQGLQRYVEGRLLDGLYFREDRKLLSGAGGGADVPGILNDPDILTYNQAGGDTKADAVLKGAAKVWSTSDGGLAPKAVLMSVDDYVSMVTAKDTAGNYVFPDVFKEALAQNAAPFVGLKWAVSPAVPVGTAVVGAFGVANALYEVEPGTLRATDSHADEFVKNIVRLLAEIEIIHTIELPQGFCKVQFS